MAIKSVSIKIKGVSALLMHRYPLEVIEAFEKKTKEEQAEISAYRSKDNKLFVPGQSLQRALISGATYSKGKGRSSLQKNAAACLLVNEEELPLGVKDYLIDSRRVVNPTTKGSVIRHRPRLNEWQVACSIQWDDSLLKETEVRKIIDDTGSRVGLLDFRPEKKGPYGRFVVTKWG